jgi:hypothetical protein
LGKASASSRKETRSSDTFSAARQDDTADWRKAQCSGHTQARTGDTLNDRNVNKQERSTAARQTALRKSMNDAIGVKREAQISRLKQIMRMFAS